MSDIIISKVEYSQTQKLGRKKNELKWKAVKAKGQSRRRYVEVHTEKREEINKTSEGKSNKDEREEIKRLEME